MHLLIPETNGWTAEYLRDDSDKGKRYELITKVLGHNPLTMRVLSAVHFSDEFLKHLRPTNGDAAALAEQLRGCSFMAYHKSEGMYRAKISFEEHLHNRLIFVEGRVYSQHQGIEELTERELLLWRRNKFDQPDTCRSDAAKYAHDVKALIDKQYFSHA